MRPGRQPWNDEQKRRLIALAKQYEVLWRRFPNMNNTRIAELRREALQQIVRHFVVDGFTVDDIKEQWRNLKDVFYKRYELIVRRAMRGEPQKMEWRYWNELKFLASDKAAGSSRRRGMQYGRTYEFIEQQLMQHEQQQQQRGNAVGERPDDDDDEEQEVIEEEEADEWTAAMPTIKDDDAAAGDDEEDNVVDVVVDEQHADGDGNRLTTAGGPHQPRMVLIKRETRSSQQQRGMVMRESTSLMRGPTMHQLGNQIDSSMSRLREVNLDHPSQKYLSMQRQQQQPARKTKKFIEMGKQIVAASKVSMPPSQMEQQQAKDRFKYFGAFVETAVRDLHQQSPDVARRLVQCIYGAVSKHQMEVTMSVAAQQQIVVDMETGEEIDVGGGGTSTA